MAETDINLAVDLDVRDAEKTAEQLNKEIQNIFNSRKGRSSAALTSVEIQLKKTRQQLTGVIDKIKELEGTQVSSKQFIELEAQLNSIESKASKLTHKMREFEESGGDTTGKKYQNWEREIEQLGNQAQQTIDKMEQLKAEGTATINAEETDQYKNLIGQADSYEDKLKQLIVRHQQLSSKGSAAFAALGKTVELLRRGMTKIISVAKKLASNLTKGSNDANKSFKKSLTTVLKYGLGIRSLYVLFNKLRAAIKEGFTNLYNSSETFKDSVDGLKGSLTTLKNSFASAFQPIVSMAIPYIQELVEWLTALMEKIAMFTAAAVGQTYYMKAIKQTGQAAEKASRQLSKLDNLNVLSSGSGSGGSMFEEVPIDEEKIDLLEKLKEIVAEMEEAGNKLGTKLRDALNLIDWERIQEGVKLVGEGIGNFINGFVRVEDLGSTIGKTFGELKNTLIDFKQSLFDAIDFEDVGRFVGDIMQSFVDTFDWKAQGELWATELNSVFETLKGVAENFEGITLGVSFGDMLNEFMADIDWDTISESVHLAIEDLAGIVNGFIETLDWSNVALTLSNGISTLLDAAIDFITNLDGDAVGSAIISFISGIDWLRLAGELALLLLSLVEMAVELLFGMAGQVAENIADLFDYLGLEGVAGFFRGISENLKTSVQWLKDTFNKYVVQPIKDFFGIHSPSTLFAEFGGMLMMGLKNGIVDKLRLIGDVMRLLKDKLFEKFTEIKIGIVNIVENLWEAIKTPINSVIGGFEFLVNCVINALNKMIGALNGMSFDVPDWIPEIGGKSFGFNIPNINEVSIPRLAQGAVVPPNREFLAVLGDQKSGTNVEAPLDTIKQALLEVLAETGMGSQKEELVVNLDGREIFRALIKQNNDYKKQHNGMSALA